MNDADRRALDRLFLDIGFSDEDYRSLGGCSSIGMAALLLADDESALLAWYDHHGRSDEPIARVLSRAVDRDDVADTIDANLAADPGILADLVRAGIIWAHPALTELLDHAAFRYGAAWMQAQTDREAFEDWLAAEREPDEVIDAARAAALGGATETFPTFAEWRDALQEVGGPWDARIDAALFILSPARWGRRFLRGDWEPDLFTDSIAMADALTAGGGSYWADSLSLWSDHPAEFAFVARLALAGAAANLSITADHDIEDLVDAFDNEDWDTLAAHPVFAVANALIPEKDDALTQLVLESAAHDLLNTRHVPSPGIRGLPLSATDSTDEELEWAAQWFAEVPDELDNAFDVVATLADLAWLVARRDNARLQAVLEAARPLLDHDHDVVAEAASRVFDPPKRGRLANNANGDDISALASAGWLARRGEESLAPLTRLWANGPPSRATRYADLLFDELRFIHSRSEP